MTITTGIRDSNADVGQKYVTTEYLIENYPHLIPSRLNSNLFGLGLSYAGTFGNNTQSEVRYSHPVQMARGTTGNGSGWVKAITNGDSVFGLKSDGSLWAWGYNRHGMLGTSSNNANGSTPTQIGTGYAYLPTTCAKNSMAAIKTDGTLWTWGYNDNGQLGHNNAVHRSTPTQVGSNTNWAKVSVGYYHMLAIKKDGTLWSWGAGFNGSLGLGSHGAPIYRSSPVQVGVATNWKEIAAGNASSFGIDTSGTMWVWGTNNLGQLGSGDTLTKYDPFNAASWSTNGPWKKVIAKSIVFAISTNNSLYGAGSGGSALGVGDTTYIPRSTPTQVGPVGVWSSVDTSDSDSTYNSSAGIRVDGTIWAWGADGGQVGTLGGFPFTKSIPTQIGSSGQWRSVAAGNTAIIGIHDGNDLSSALPVTSYIDPLLYWQNVSASRTFGVTYTNNYGVPIQIVVGGSTFSAGGGIYITVDGVTLTPMFAYSGSVTTASPPIIVPPGSTYSASAYGSTTYASWYELPLCTSAAPTNGIGYNQTWTDVTASRALSTTYTNNTGKPIQVQVGAQTSGSGGGVYITVDGVTISPSWTHTASIQTTSAAAIVPPGSTYSASIYGTGTYFSWFELRGSVSSGGTGLGYTDAWHSTWRSLSGKNFGVTYINGTPEPRQIVVAASTTGAGGGVYITINGVTLPPYFSYSSAVTVSSGAYIVPAGARYSASAYGGATYAAWYELGGNY